MEGKSSYHPIKDENSHGMIRSSRASPPAHFRYKLNSFGLLSDFIFESGGQRLRSDGFPSCGFEWKLVIYPEGDKERNGDGHISVYLLLADAVSFPVGLQIHAIFKLFLYDHIRKKYLIVEKENCGATVFHNLKTEDGFSRFIPLDSFHDKSSGFKEGEFCEFGAEVYVLENEPVIAKDACLTNFSTSKAFSYLFKFSKISDVTSYYSPHFSAGKTKWFLNLRRYTSPDGTSFVDLALTFANPVNFPRSTFSRGRSISGRKKAVFVKATLSIEDQLHGKHASRNFIGVFSHPNNNLACKTFLNMNRAEDLSLGYVKNGKMKINVDLSVVELY